ncbi:MAG: arsenic resistance protein [Cyclobacteriaceae bacterium]|nr:arsenic resistance protein [Cyclobacteriaceae bacterium HetDA_MAG_MS6]
MANVFVSLKPYSESLLLVAAIVAGSLTGQFTSFQAYGADYFIIAMLFFLFYNISFTGFFKGIKNGKYISLALLSNFVVLPFVAFLVSSIFIDKSSAIFIGLIIYLIAPCTDWFLGFTKLAHGDVEANSALLPFNLIMQMLLLPIYLYVFTFDVVSTPFKAFLNVMIYWVFFPFALAQLARMMVAKFKADMLDKSSALADLLVVIALTFLVFCIFNSNIKSLMANAVVLPQIVIAILSFFVAAFFLARVISRTSMLSKKEEISLTMTTAARNAPLMLMVSLIFYPQEPLIHLVLVVGMLVEFPHLIAITYLLKMWSQSSPLQEDRKPI